MRNRILCAAFAATGGLLCATFFPSAASATAFTSLTTTYANIDASVGSIDATIHVSGGPVNGEGARVGRIRLIGTDNQGQSQSLPVYCVDVYDWLGNGTFTQTTIGALDFTSAQIDNVVKFLVYADPLVTNATTSAAAQLGVWEILNEATTAWDVTSGAFSASSYGGDDISGATTLANQWLALLAGGTLQAGQNRLAVLDPGHGNQTQAYITASGGSHIGIGDVPEPATWAMIVMGFGMLGAALRRRKDASVFA